MRPDLTEQLTFDLHHGCCLDVLKAMRADSVDAIVTDPPYGLSFMGKKWDYDVPGTEVWAECLRVLKPGGHLLAFAGTRTQHRMAVRIEDAGFEIRDMIAWVYGSGFPKSLDVSKAIDKAAGAEREKVRKPCAATAYSSNAGNMRPWVERAQELGYTEVDGEAPATREAAAWQGWGTALKPALEPITVARKPLIGTVAANVQEHGTGALNIDGCRVPTDDTLKLGKTGLASVKFFTSGEAPVIEKRQHDVGRFPANLIHDGSDEVVAHFPDSKGQQGAVTGEEPSSKTSNAYGQFNGRNATPPRGDNGSAARFFYAAKTSKRDRGAENNHPTVKPTDLMAYLVRLVTPPGGVVLDPFMGSGSTGKAAMLEGFRFTGIEREAAYWEIAHQRIGEAAFGDLA